MPVTAITSLAQFKQVIESAEKPVIIDFWAA